MMAMPSWAFPQLAPSRRRMRLADRYARWEYGMPDATPLLWDSKARRESRGSRRSRMRRKTPLRHLGRSHPFRLLAMLMPSRLR
jgi:hypothetical protein